MVSSQTIFIYNGQLMTGVMVCISAYIISTIVNWHLKGKHSKWLIIGILTILLLVAFPLAGDIFSVLKWKDFKILSAFSG